MPAVMTVTGPIEADRLGSHRYPRPRARGIDEATIDEFLIDNPRRLLAGA